MTTKFFTPLSLAFICAASLGLVGCGSSTSETGTAAPTAEASGNPLASMLSPTSSAESSEPSAANSDALKGLGCGWTAASDADTANIAFPDKAARYWVALIPMTPGNRLRIDGVYPNARYFSFNSYDLALRPTDAIADRDLKPVAGSRNPFVEQDAPIGGRYTGFLNFGPAPSPRAENTFYTGSVGAGPVQVPNAVVVPIIYRTYVATGERQDGGVALPLLTLESTSGQVIGTLPTCSEPFLPNLGGLLPKSSLNEQINNADYPNQLALPFPTAVYPPTSRRFYGLSDTAMQIVINQLGLSDQASQLPALPATGGGGFLSNVHNDYTSSAFARRYGNLFLMRAKAPSYRSQPGVAFGREQMRYWSLCQNEFATQRYTDCSFDRQTPLDADGYFTVAISDTAERPAAATAANGITWLPWGAYPDGVLLYRQMLVDDNFKQAIRDVPNGASLTDIMGDYAPQVTYCRPEVFEQASLSARQRFDACLADQKANPAAGTTPAP
ncbi:MAG: hypothetical protein AABY68_06720 [Pseudomonadota bacterium]